VQATKNDDKEAMKKINLEIKAAGGASVYQVCVCVFVCVFVCVRVAVRCSVRQATAHVVAVQKT